MVMYYMTSTPKINEGLLMIFIRAIRIYKRDGIDVDALVMDVGSDLQRGQPCVVGDEAVHGDVLTVHVAVDPVTYLYRHHRRVEVMIELEGGRREEGGEEGGREGGRERREEGGREYQSQL